MNIQGKTWYFDSICLLFRVILGGIFFYAGSVKILDPQGFAQAVYNYHLLAGWAINPLAIVLPWIEVIAGAGLVLGVFIHGGSLVISGMLAMFACALGFNLVRGLDISCGCFSTAHNAAPITWMYLVRDLLLMCMGICVFYFDSGRYAFKNMIQRQ